MSRMTKFLKQTCSMRSYLTDESGAALYNEFGELQYGEPVILRCRSEPYARDILTEGGHIISISTRYFLDDSLNIRVNDLLDGRAVLQCSGYTNQFGKLEGYEVYV